MSNDAPDPAVQSEDPVHPEEGKNPRRGMAAAVLCLEAITLALSVPVMISVADVAPKVALPVGLGLAVACLLVAGMLRTSWGYALGWALQVAVIALGFWVTTMFTLGGIFALLWGCADFLGRRIERERAEAFDRWRATTLES